MRRLNEGVHSVRAAILAMPSLPPLPQNPVDVRATAALGLVSGPLGVPTLTGVDVLPLPLHVATVAALGPLMASPSWPRPAMVQPALESR